MFKKSSRFAAVVAALLSIAFPVTSAGQDVTVNVDGRPLQLNPGPLERAGRVFVPLRGIFERLGAAVVYSSGTINATKQSTTVSLRIGSTQATLNGQPQTLDAAPFIVGATTYVPLRFVAQSLGANVGYDSSTRVVSIESGNAAPAPSGVRLRAQEPPPGSNTTNRFSVISAEFVPSVQASSVRVSLDGSDVTYRCGISSTAFSYKPPAPLAFGSHRMRATGRGSDGSAFDRAWSFNVRAPAMRLTINQPSANAPVGRSFTLSGNTLPNANVRITAGPSPLGTGEFSGTTVAGPKGNFLLQVNLSTLIGQQAVTVKVTATDPASSQSTQTTLQLRLSI